MSNLVKNLLKLVQIFSVVMIPLVAINYFTNTTSNDSWLSFLTPYCYATGDFFEKITGISTVGNDLTVVFLILPFVIVILVFGILANLMEGVDSQVSNTVMTIKKNQLQAAKAREKENVNVELVKKQAIFLLLELAFTKYVINAVSEEDVSDGISCAKNTFAAEVALYKGKQVELDEDKDDNTLLFRFFSQEDALNFAKHLTVQSKEAESALQNVGMSVNYKVIIDCQMINVMHFYVYQLLKKAAKTVELNETAATSDFVDRYRIVGLNKNLEFVSKGTYIINKEKVEIFRVDMDS